MRSVQLQKSRIGEPGFGNPRRDIGWRYSVAQLVSPIVNRFSVFMRLKRSSNPEVETAVDIQIL